MPHRFANVTFTDSDKAGLHLRVFEALALAGQERAMGNVISGDLNTRVAMDTSDMSWSASPSGAVWRKRVHLVGPPESGQVTSVVRYEAGATFPEHNHPDGEEILVLEGVFSDEHGDWPKGSYLLNPDGFRHAPFSTEGCVIFVKLRQFPGEDRHHVAIQTSDLAWKPTGQPGVTVKHLYEQPGYADRMRLECWATGATVTNLYPEGAELFLIDGRFDDDLDAYMAGTWIRLPNGSSHTARTIDECTLYIKEGGFTYLDTAADGG